MAQEALRQSLDRIDRQLLMDLKRQVQDAQDSIKSAKQANDQVLEDELSNPGKYVEPRKYEIMFTTDGIKDDFMLKIAVKEPGVVRPLPPYEKMKASENQFPITGTPFGRRVEFVYHAKLAFDFVIPKVSPGETQYGGLCGFSALTSAAGLAR